MPLVLRSSRRIIEAIPSYWQIFQPKKSAEIAALYRFAYPELRLFIKWLKQTITVAACLIPIRGCHTTP